MMIGCGKEPPMSEYDYRYSKEAREHELKLCWKCDTCGNKRRDYPTINEGGSCHCGGTYMENGESYLG